MSKLEGAVIKAKREAWGKQEELVDLLADEGLGWDKQSSGVRALSRLEATGTMGDRRRYRRILEIIGIEDEPALLVIAGAVSELETKLDRVLGLVETLENRSGKDVERLVAAVIATLEGRRDVGQ